MEAALNSVAYEFVLVNNDEEGCDRTQAEEAIAQQESEVIPQLVISLQVDGAIAKRCCKQFASYSFPQSGAMPN